MVAGGLSELASALRAEGRHITIETAATVPPARIACDLASLSPKLRNSDPGAAAPPGWRERHEARRLRPGIIREWVDSYPYQLKFVVAKEEDLEEIRQLLKALDRDIPSENVLLMPEGVDPAVLKTRSEWLAGICLEQGYRFTPRLHIELFGNTRGT